MLLSGEGRTVIYALEYSYCCNFFFLFVLFMRRDLNGLSLEGVLAPDLAKLTHLKIL